MDDGGRLLAWYDAHRRALPWRTAPPDPYRVLVSEVMLQQTRVETVLPYFDRFLNRFGDVQQLAEAAESEVLIHWAGLGYYRRARQLHQAAKKIVSTGNFPHTSSDLKELPGVGSYTAAAVASIAFGEPVPVLDGNVLRVQSRRLGLREARSAAARGRIDLASRELLVAGRAGDSNQALMELGATVCTPKRPACEDCPLASGCLAAKAGDPESFPEPRRRRAVERYRLLAVLARDPSGRILFFQRPLDGPLLAGSWELPWVPADSGEVPGDSPARLSGALRARYGGRWTLGASLGTTRHQITHRALRVELVQGVLGETGEVAEGVEGRWVEPAEVAGLARSSLVDKLLRRAGL